MGKRKEIDEKEIIRLYTEDNFSASKIGRLFNADVATITNRLKSNNIEVKKIFRKYLIRNDYFEVIDSEDKATYPTINSKYDRFFVKGIFDGDGSLSYSMDGNYRRYTFSIVGNLDLLNSIKNILSPLKVNISLRKEKTIHAISIRGNRQILKVLEWIYKDTLTHLDRKYEKYQDMLNYYKNK